MKHSNPSEYVHISGSLFLGEGFNVLLKGQKVCLNFVLRHLKFLIHRFLKSTIERYRAKLKIYAAHSFLKTLEDTEMNIEFRVSILLQKEPFKMEFSGKFDPKKEIYRFDRMTRRHAKDCRGNVHPL